MAQPPPDDLTAVFERAAKERDSDGAGLVLSSLLTDESKVRRAFLASIPMDERSVYVFFGGRWGSRAHVEWGNDVRYWRIQAESVSAKPSLIRPAIRAERYKSFFFAREGGGAATLNYFPFFSWGPYADDVVERFMERLRRANAGPAKPLVADGIGVVRTAEEVEVDLLITWQMVCGTCDRLDLVDKATSESWRVRFPELDRWFQRNRPYILWDKSKSSIRIDEEAKDLALPTPRRSRRIPELKPPWLTQQPR